jgi:Zinc-binding loop region of homing endonuclease
MSNTNSSRTHNKSGLTGLSLLESDDEALARWARALRKTLTPMPALCQGSDCLLLPAQDGRFSYQRRKVAFGYQIVAFEKFGRDALAQVEASKDRSSKLLSHICGTRNCCNVDHIVIETKGINDERTHCHFCMLNVFNASGHSGVARFLELGGCPHTPRCGSITLLEGS